ncbi:MAG TPA: hypothetical protein VK909_05965 [Anaerolineales bacterium]|nr:hypothetical protein [Anaerolineales bacterium]
MLELNFHLPETDDEPLRMGEWFYELVWSPSQCYYRLQHHGIDYIVYLRWSHKNPWQAYVIKNAVTLEEMHKENALWSEDIFQLHNVHYTYDEVESAKQKVIRLFYKFNTCFPKYRI